MKFIALLVSALVMCALRGGTGAAHGQGATGAIAGGLSYPSEGTPAMVVYAFPVDNSGIAFVVQTSNGDTTYAMNGLPVGVYDVVAYRGGSPAGSTAGGGYTAAVACGLQAGCDDHTLISVIVTGGAMLTSIDLRDWYAPEGTFPPKPDSL
jgi:hypothetical protein